jgi:hypothetical protein
MLCDTILQGLTVDPSGGQSWKVLGWWGKKRATNTHQLCEADQQRRSYADQVRSCEIHVKSPILPPLLWTLQGRKVPSSRTDTESHVTVTGRRYAFRVHSSIWSTFTPRLPLAVPLLKHDICGTHCIALDAVTAFRKTLRNLVSSTTDWWIYKMYFSLLETKMIAYRSDFGSKTSLPWRFLERKIPPARKTK